SEEHTSELQSHLNLVCRLPIRSEEHTSELQSHLNLVCRLLLEKKKNKTNKIQVNSIRKQDDRQCSIRSVVSSACRLSTHCTLLLFINRPKQFFFFFF